MSEKFEQERLEREAIVKPYVDTIERLRKEKDECGVLIRKLYTNIKEFNEQEQVRREECIAPYMKTIERLTKERAERDNTIKELREELTCERQVDLSNGPTPLPKNDDNYDVLEREYAKLRTAMVTIHDLERQLNKTKQDKKDYMEIIRSLLALQRK